MHKATISREVWRNRGKRGYRPQQAHRWALQWRQAKARPRIVPQTLGAIDARLQEDWSPEQLGGWLKQGQADSVSPDMDLSAPPSGQSDRRRAPSVATVSQTSTQAAVRSAPEPADKELLGHPRVRVIPELAKPLLQGPGNLEVRFLLIGPPGNANGMTIEIR